MKIYLDNGYLDIHSILSEAMPFNFIVGGRGIGKTYGALKECIESGRRFLLLRRTQAQADLISKPEFSPFKKLCDDNGWQITTFPVTKYNALIGDYDYNEDDKLVRVGAKIYGYTAALSTFSNLRGFDASDVDTIIYDEFIPELHERPIKNEFSALMNCYETVNRNRELQGKPPVQLVCLANANDVGNPVFVGLDLVKTGMKMLDKKWEYTKDSKRGILLLMLQRSPISAGKANTALYRLTSGTEFSKMSLNNEFSYNEVGNIRPMPLNEFKPVAIVGKLCIYKHKSKQQFYCSTHKSGSPPEYGDGPQDLRRFKKAFGWVYVEYLKNNIFFEDYLCELTLVKYEKCVL